MGLLITWTVIAYKRDPITRMVKAWSRLAHLIPPYVQAISIGSLVWNDDRNRREMMKAFREGLKPYYLEWKHGVIGTWSDPIEASIEFKQGRPFRFFIRFNLNEPQLAFFLKSLPHPFAFGTAELALGMKQLGILKNVNWPE